LVLLKVDISFSKVKSGIAFCQHDMSNSDICCLELGRFIECVTCFRGISCLLILAPFLSMCFAERKKAVDEASSKLVYQPYNRQQPLQSQQQPAGETTSEGFLSPPSTAAVSSDGMSSFDNERGMGLSLVKFKLPLPPST
jgi:hypothetical protein